MLLNCKTFYKIFFTFNLLSKRDYSIQYFPKVLLDLTFKKNETSTIGQWNMFWNMLCSLT